MSFSLSSQFYTIEGSATGTKRTDTQAYVRYERTADLAVNLASVIISGLSAIHRNMVCPDFH